MNLVVAFLFAAGAIVCHQRPDRSFFWDGHQLPVCARCTGLYLSGAVGFLGWLAVKAARRWSRLAIDPRLALQAIVCAAVPTAFSWTSGVLGWWDGSNVTRAVLAIPLGACAGAVVAAVSTKDLR